MKFLQVPKLRVWHFLGIVAAIAGYLAVSRFREEVYNPYTLALRQLRYGDVEERYKGVGGVCSEMRPETFDALLRATHDAAGVVRSRAAHGLVDAVNSVRADDPKGSRETLFAAWEKPSLQAIERLLGDPDPDIRLQAAKCLKFLQEKNATAHAILVKTAHNASSPDRWEAIYALIVPNGSDPDARAEIMKSAGSAVAGERAQGIAGLRYWKHDAEIPPEILDLLAKGLKDPNRDVRASAAGAACYAGDKFRRLLPDLVAALDDPSDRVGYNATIALAGMGIHAEPALTAMKKFATKDPDIHRTDVEKIIGDLESTVRGFREKFLPESRRDLAHPDASTRKLAALALGMTGPPARDLVPDLIRTLGDPDAKVRLASAMSLGKIDPEQAKAALRQAADSDPDDEVRSAAKASLGMR